MKSIYRRLASIVLLLGSSSSVAQTGSLLYGPSTNSIPVASSWAYIALSLALGVCAYLVLRNNGSSRSGISGMVLALTLGIFALAQPWLAKEVSARLNNPQSFLSNPNGGTVVVQAGSQNFLNNSGVAQRIKGITPPCALPNTAVARCRIGDVILNGDSCDTDYACP